MAAKMASAIAGRGRSPRSNHAAAQTKTGSAAPIMDVFAAAWLALSINESAYQVEINRSALQSIDAGQLAAGEALGLTQLQIYCYVLIPQAIRVAIPPTSNEFITLLKVTSLASVISLQELMTTTQIAVARSFQFAEHYSAALIYYLVMVYTLMGLQSRVERTFSWATRAAPGRKGIAPVFKVDAPRH
jgi:ABC-type amino acid transport system permease subunit